MRRTLRRFGLLLLLLAVLGTCSVLGSWSFEQRSVFRPKPGPATPEDAGLAGYQRREFTSDGLRIPYWWHDAPEGPILLYFHGNGAGLWGHAALLSTHAQAGLAVAAMEYRGYPGAPGTPSQHALVADALALYDHIHAQAPGRPIALWGYSLGSGVAVQLAAQRPVAALVLEAPFTSLTERAHQLFPYAYTGLMRHPFDSQAMIGELHAPLLILHGGRDGVVPISMAEALFARAREPKTFLRYPQAGHMNLGEAGAYAAAANFLRHPTP